MLLAALCGVPLLLAPKLTVLALLATGLLVAVMLKPVVAAYALLLVTPLVVGIDRDLIVPVLRPSEALALLLGVALAGRGVFRIIAGEPLRFRFTRLDAVLLVLAVTGSVVPVLWLLVRRRPVTADDALYALTLWKYLGAYVIVRVAVRTEEQVRKCLWLTLGAGCVVAVIAILQALLLFGVSDLMATYYAPMGDEAALFQNRGRSTLASSIATGDVMAFSLAIALAMLAKREKRRPVLQAMSVLFVFGGLASGQFSAALALVIVVLAVGKITGQLTRRIVAMVPVALIGAVAMAPVIERRLSGFNNPDGLPPGWLGRLQNLRTYFWPELFSNLNFVLGVRPAARIPATETWRQYIWMESGHTWLLWTGGIPFALAFVALVWVGMRTVAGVAAARGDAIGAAAVGAFAALAVITALMTLDVHLTLRGAADLLFALLALSLVRTSSPPASVPERGAGGADRILAGAR